jgi:hypothetical protein
MSNNNNKSLCLSSFLGHGVLMPACFVGNNSWDKGLVDLALCVYDRLFLFGCFPFACYLTPMLLRAAILQIREL